jgi:hypothetical protein
MAGYVGCVHAHSRKNIVDDQGYLLDQWLTVSGGELISQYMSAHQVLVIDKTSNNEVLIKNSDGLKADDVVFLENCWGAELAKIKKISSVNYGAQKKIQFYYPIKASETKNFYLAKLVLHKFYVKKTSRKNAKGDYIFSLYVTNEKNDSDEILENIQSMNIKKSHNNFVISIAESKNSSPILLAAKGYNAN